MNSWERTAKAKLLQSFTAPSLSLASGSACLSRSNMQAFPSSCKAAAWSGVHCGPFSFCKVGEAIESNKVFKMFTWVFVGERHWKAPPATWWEIHVNNPAIFDGKWLNWEWLIDMDLPLPTLKRSVLNRVTVISESKYEINKNWVSL